MKPESALYFNPSCSKCRTAEALLKDHGVEPIVVRYLESAPTIEELTHLMTLLAIDDPREMMRQGESAYRELGLAHASNPQLLAAMAQHPILLERPIFVLGGRAVIARPPERLLELL